MSPTLKTLVAATERPAAGKDRPAEHKERDARGGGQGAFQAAVFSLSLSWRIRSNC